MKPASYYRALPINAERVKTVACKLLCLDHFFKDRVEANDYEEWLSYGFLPSVFTRLIDDKKHLSIKQIAVIEAAYDRYEEELTEQEEGWTDYEEDSRIAHLKG